MSLCLSLKTLISPETTVTNSGCFQLSPNMHKSFLISFLNFSSTRGVCLPFICFCTVQGDDKEKATPGLPASEPIREPLPL